MLLHCSLLVPLALSSLGCASMSRATASAIGAAVATLAVHATAAVIQEAAREGLHRTREGEDLRPESPCERRRREWLELRVNPRDEPPERLNCRSNGDFGTEGGVAEGYPGDEIEARPSATVSYPTF